MSKPDPILPLRLSFVAACGAHDRAAGDGRPACPVRASPSARVPLRAAAADRDRPALALEPEVIVYDGPGPALDLPVRAQALNLLCHLRDEPGLS